MSSRDPPDDKGKRGVRQTIGSTIQKAKDKLKRPSSPRLPAGTSEHLSPFSFRSWSQSLLRHSTPSLVAGAPAESQGFANTPGPSVRPSVLNPGVKAIPEDERLSDATRSRLTNSLHALKSSVALFPPLQSAVGAFIGCLDTALIVESNRADYEELANDFQSMVDILKQYSGQLKSESSNGSIAYIAQSIQDQVADIKKQNERGTIGRLLDANQDQEDVIRRYRHVDRLFRQLQCDLTIRTKDIVEKQLETTLLRGMLPVDDARYNSGYSTTIRRRGCTAKTREAIHQNLQDWTTDPGSEKIYWMNGMAGTGKTTIAYSYCEWLESTSRLGASFFCSRISSTCRSLNQIVPTIAYQLAHFSPAFGTILCAALKRNPDVGKLNVMQQFEGLINVPMSNAKSAIPDNVVVVIDALDECDDNYSVRLLLDVLLKFAERLPLKFFVASRPEHAIRDRMVSQGGATRAIVHLHDIEKSIVEEDIKKYLTDALSSMSPPPSAEQIAALAKRSRNLFIYAATVVRYIHPEDIHVDSTERLEAIIEAITAPNATSKDKYEDLDRLYATVLSAVFSTRLNDNERNRTQRVLWTVVCAKEPITVETIAIFGSLSERQVWAALESLRSVVHVPENNTLISALHASFPEYMLDRSRSKEFYCDESHSNEILAHRLFEIMKSELRFNICNLKSSFLSDGQIENLEAQVTQNISPPLSYACRYWGGHLLVAPTLESTRKMVTYFLSNQLLFWMEVLSLNRCIGIGAPMMQQVQTWLRRFEDTSDAIQKQVSDARNFVTWFAANPCSRSTSHIYISALPLCAKSNWVHQNYMKHTKGLADITMSQRDDAVLAIWTTESAVCSVSISPDGNSLAAGLGNGEIHIYDVHTGAIAVGPLKGHSDFVNSVTFSPDGTLIASGSDDRSVIIWDAQTGSIVIGPLRGHENHVWSVAFSPDGDRVASGSEDKSVIIWNRDSGEIAIGPLRGHTGTIYSVAFSPNGHFVASGSDDHTIRVWNASNGIALTKPFEGHQGGINMVAFSSTGSQIASCSNDTTIRLWDVQTGTLTRVLEGHTSDIRSIAYSSEGFQIVSGEFRGNYNIMVWDALTGAITEGPLRGHTDIVRSIAFLPNSSHIVSCSNDQTIRIWDTSKKNKSYALPNAHESPVGPVAFSPAGTQFISKSLGGALRSWDVHTGTPVPLPFGEQPDLNSIHSIVFDHRGLRVAASTDDYSIRVWNVAAEAMPPRRLLGHQGLVGCLAFSPNGTHLCSGSDDCTIIVWDIEASFVMGRPYEGHTASVHSVAYSPNSTLIASGAADHTVRVWDPATGTLIHTLTGHDESVNSVAFSPDGRYIVSGSDDWYIRRWEVDAPSDSVREYCGRAVKCVAFSPDGTRVIAGGGSAIRVFDTQLMEVLSVLYLPSDEKVHWVGFCPDGTSIISVSVSENEANRQETEGTDQPPPQQPNIIRVWQADAHPDDSDPSAASGTWSYKADGRILSPDGFLLWVSPDVIRYLGESTESYRCAFVMSSDGVIDFRSKDPDLCIGERWAECYVGKE